MSALALMILLGAKADPGLDAYKQGKFQRAVELLSASLATMSASDRGGAYEIGVREKLVLSLYAMKKEESAIAEYHELKRRFPGFAFDADRMSPETLAFFDRHPPPAKPVEEVKAAPTSSTDAQPRVVQPPPAHPIAVSEKKWHWYYLAPLGIGQFLAGSPIRGSLVLVAQVGFIVLDAVAFAMLAPTIKSNNTVEDLNRARTLQIMANVGFFGWIGALALGTLDGALFEP